MSKTKRKRSIAITTEQLLPYIRAHRQRWMSVCREILAIDRFEQAIKDPAVLAQLPEQCNKPHNILNPAHIIGRLSDTALLTMAWFMYTCVHDEDEIFRQAMINELHRRGVLKKPTISYDAVNPDAFEQEELDSFAEMYCRPDEPTLEDSFVLATLGIDRFAQRGPKAWPSK